jgi:hypothetical protein
MDDRTVRALLGVVGLYAAAAAACHAFLRWYRPQQLDDVTLAAGLLGLPLAASIGFLWGSRGYFQEARLILRSVAQPSLEDGKRVVVVGRIEALGPTLRAPFTGTRCVAYQYEIDHVGTLPRQRNRMIRVRDYWGMAVCPWHVRTAAGPVRMLAYARIEAPPDIPTEDEAYRAAEAHLASTSFRHPASPGERMGSLAEPLSTESDTFGDDICADDAHLHLERGRGAELRKLRILERRLHVGEAVCAAGVYSAARQALVPSGAGSKPLRISTYGPEIWAADNLGWGRTYILWGVGLGIFSIGCALATRWC